MPNPMSNATSDSTPNSTPNPMSSDCYIDSDGRLHIVVHKAPPSDGFTFGDLTGSTPMAEIAPANLAAVQPPPSLPQTEQPSPDRQVLEQIARAKLAKALAEGKNNSDEAYRTYAFHVGLPEADGRTAYAEGGLMGWRDEIYAAARAANDALHGESFSTAYPFYEAAERERYAKYREQYPIRAAAFEAAGNLTANAAASALTAGALPAVVEGSQAARFGYAAGKGLLDGALTGGIKDAGESTGNWQDRVDAAKLVQWQVPSRGIDRFYAAGQRARESNFDQERTGLWCRCDENLIPPFGWAPSYGSPVEQFLR